MHCDGIPKVALSTHNKEEAFCEKDPRYKENVERYA